MIVVKNSTTVPAGNRPVEIVERKGVGHPDTLIDNIMESISRKLCKEYLDNFGAIAHHNVDKGLIVGGESTVSFEKAEVTKPIHLYLTGRATREYEGKKVDVESLSIEAAKKELSKVRNLSIEEDVTYESNIRQGSADLVELFMRSKVPLANDTSFGVGYAPYSKLENTVLEIEERLNSEAFKQVNPWIGEDIKVMGLRDGDNANITLAVAFVAKHLSSAEEYWDKKAKLKEEVERIASKHFEEPNININTADSGDSVYITATGSSIEAGDDGSVGRGNRINGMITPMRPMTLEAAAGKNPVTHVGKIYSAAAFHIARDIYKEVDADISVSLLSEIGKPISEPKVASIEVYGSSFDEKKARDIAAYHLENISDLTYDFIEGKIGVA
ncbi:MAG: methionine adenosyltransferase [Methanobacteriota archaeon]|nr:MAG: methionine adenosyltransferase [Euryarchaeota archaeon]